MFGEHDHELTENDRDQHSQGFNPDYEKYGIRLAIVAFNNSSIWATAAIIWISVWTPTDHQEDDRYDLGAIEHHRHCGFPHNIMQAVRGLEEGMPGPYHKHRFGIYHLFRVHFHDRIQETRKNTHNNNNRRSAPSTSPSTSHWRRSTNDLTKVHRNVSTSSVASGNTTSMRRSSSKSYTPIIATSIAGPRRTTSTWTTSILTSCWTFSLSYSTTPKTSATKPRV